MKYCAILGGKVMWAYTLESIRESVKMAAYYGDWKIYVLNEVQ